MSLVCIVVVASAIAAGCSGTGAPSGPEDAVDSGMDAKGGAEGAVVAPADAGFDVESGVDATVVAPADSGLDVGNGSEATIVAPADSGLDAESGAYGDAALSYPSGGEVQLGHACAASSPYGFGSGSLLFCDSASWRYALRSDVPNGTYGGFTSRPSWYPPLRFVYAFANWAPAADACKLSLAQAPIDPSQITSIVPNGAMLGVHVTPIDHAYIGVTGTAGSPTPIYAPADGTVLLVASLVGPNTIQIVIAHSCETLSLYWVVNQLAGVLAPYQSTVAAGGRASPLLSVKAGDLIGEQWLTPMDFAIQDGAVWLSGFAHPFPYVSQAAWEPYTADPLAYLPQPAASQYQAKMQRAVSPNSGKIDWDTAGTAAGNWYLTGTIGYSGNASSAYGGATTPVTGGQVPGKNGYSWSHLALAPHWVQPSVWLASIGSWADQAGDGVQLAIRPGPVPPNQLTVGQTAIYELARWNTTAADGGSVDNANPPVGYQVVPATSNVGVLAVRVNSDNTLTVEKRPDLTSAASFTGFTSLAETYWR